ncbi:MAG TPA: glycosyltransferase [Segetibacter sp.]|nr:glycosyltransferase [Segetibacter sp.]
MILVNRNIEHCSVLTNEKITVKGKFLFLGNEKFYIKGVTYGTFKPDDEGFQFPEPAIVEKDFAMMAAEGINSVRVYTVPPQYLLDIAYSQNLKVMVGLPWEQHITFLDDKTRKQDILNRVKAGVLSCGKHPAILCFAIGNEIPASIVRWYGKKKIEQFLRDLYQTVKEANSESLVTYVNFPTTEYLDLSFLDFDCFNVYLETPEKLTAYISRLHNLSGDRPLVLAEIGLDSMRNGEKAQAEILTWQIQSVFGKGCAGMFIFAWTDEWWRGGFEIEDWDFGLVDRNRHPKLALGAVSQAMENAPFALEKFPFISVVICTYNGARTIEDTLSHLMKLTYPAFEIIVINDGSKDNTAALVRKYPVRLISTINKGLSNARNTGMENANGEIIAYIDDDAYPDDHWLHYLAYSFSTSSHGAMGGPNIAPEEDGPVATCVANAPGGPVHVLVSDEIAEHVPGCNLAVRTAVLKQIGGFDPIYRSAGDDVDVCWRIQEAGYTIGFHPSAVVWHHRRNSLKAYWNQQKGYGKAEALLEAKWPEKYNGFGHLTWAGRIYGNGFTLPIKVKKDRIFHGTWGSALFQSVYQPAEGFLTSLPLMPEWYLITSFLGIIAALGFLWSPLLWFWPFVLLSVVVVVSQAVISSSKNVSLHPLKKNNLKYRALIIALHIVQPLARLYGRFKHGLTPWRKRGAGLHSKYLFVFGTRTFTHWSEEWRAAEDWLKDIEEKLMGLKTRVKRGGDYDKWDLQIRNGLYSKARGLLAIEEHGAGKQFIRFKCKAHYTLNAFLIPAFVFLIAVVSAAKQQWFISGIMDFILIIFLIRFILENGSSMNSLYTAFKLLSVKEPVETMELVRKQKVNAELNEALHAKEMSLETYANDVVQ